MYVLIIDDDRVLADVLAFALQRAGYQVIQAYDGFSALDIWERIKPDLIILDINLPGIDGFTVCEQIRKEADTPIIMLTVRSRDEDIVRGLELGADDYIVKPFSPRQLVARAHAVLRRAGLHSLKTSRRVWDLFLESNRCAVRNAQGESIALTNLEARLLEVLILNADQDLSSDAIIDRVWGQTAGDRIKLRQLVHRLRRKIESDPSNPFIIKTIPGIGYRLIENSKNDADP